MPLLKIKLFGRVCIELAEEALSGLDSCKAQELFCYLLLHRDRPHPREALAGMLWADCPTSQSRKYLRQALWQLQTALFPHIEHGGERLLVVDSDWVHLRCGAHLSLDVADFEQASALAQGLPGHSIDEQTALALQGAVQLYEADLLEGWYQDWCLYERERLQNLYLTMLDKLMYYCESKLEYEMGLVYGAHITRYDRARECAHRQMMRLHYLSGDRTSALRQYEKCAAALHEELGVKPDRSTAMLYEQIRADRLTNAQPAPPRGVPAPAPPGSSLPNLLSSLKQLRSALSEIQKQVQQEIQAVELTLGDKC